MVKMTQRKSPQKTERAVSSGGVEEAGMTGW